MSSSRIRLLLFFLAVVLYATVTGGFFLSKYPPALDPFLFLIALAGGIVTLSSAIPAIIILLFSIWKKRFFCRFICPLGCAFELTSKGVKRFLFPRPLVTRRIRVRFIGPILVLLTFCIVAFQIPNATGFQCFDPLILFGAFFQPKNPLFYVSVGLLFFAVLTPWLWCGSICPLGAFQEMLFFIRSLFGRHRKLKNNFKYDTDDLSSIVSIDRKLETELNESGSIVDQTSQDRNKDAKPDSERSNSGLKKKNLPTNEHSAVADTTGYGQSRRSFLLRIPACLFLLFSLFILKTPFSSCLTPLFGRSFLFFRPPGSEKEPRFTNLCSSCGRCIEVCPTKHLIPISDLFSNSMEISEQGAKNNSTPILETSKTYCDSRCDACSRVCPTGAIRRFNTEDKKQIQVGIVQYEFENCVLYNSKDCNICVRECPYEAIGLIWNEEYYVNLPTVDPEKCTGCGRCIVFCPGFDPIYRGEDEDSSVEEENGEIEEFEETCETEENANSVENSENSEYKNSDEVIEMSSDIKTDVNSVQTWQTSQKATYSGPPKAFKLVPRTETVLPERK